MHTARATVQEETCTHSIVSQAKNTRNLKNRKEKQSPSKRVITAKVGLTTIQATMKDQYKSIKLNKQDGSALTRAGRETHACFPRVIWASGSFRPSWRPAKFEFEKNLSRDVTLNNECK